MVGFQGLKTKNFLASARYSYINTYYQYKFFLTSEQLKVDKMVGFQGVKNKKFLAGAR